MPYLDITTKITSITLNTRSAEDPDQPVTVMAGKLFEWAWLIAELAGWLNDADEYTHTGFDRFFGGYRGAEKTAWFLTHIAERMAALLDGDWGQP